MGKTTERALKNNTIESLKLTINKEMKDTDNVHKVSH